MKFFVKVHTKHGLDVHYKPFHLDLDLGWLLEGEYSECQPLETIDYRSCHGVHMQS